MAVSILLLHRTAIFLGCPIKYKTLTLCAVMALLVNFATLNISPFLTPMHYALILAFVLTASLAVTFYNARLLKKEGLAASANIRGEPSSQTAAKAEATGTQEAEKPDAKEASQEAEVEVTDAKKTSQEAEAEAEKPDAGEASQEAEAEVTDAGEASQEAEAEVTDAREASQETEAEVTDAEKASQEAEAKVTDAEKASQEAEAEVTDAGKASQEAEAEKPDAGEASQETEAEEPDAGKASREAEAEVTDTEDLELEPAVLPSEEERRRAKEELKELTKAVSRLHSMDDYLDYADKEARAHRPRRAVFAYKQALGIYWNDDYAPFIAINLGNTYKEMGDYEAASDTYEAALTLPATQNSIAMQQEFHRSVDYLRTVQHILAKHGIANMPFAEVPSEISAEIESATRKA